MHDLIGVAGTALSGKDVFAEYLREKYKYSHISTGDMVREIAQKEAGSIERPVLHEIATQYRAQHGGDYFMKLALAQHDSKKVITGIRSLGEAKALQAAGGFLLFIDVPVETRYKRMLSRARDNEVELSLEQFTTAELTEWYQGDGDGDFNLRGIKQIADAVINKDLGLDEFFTHATKLVTAK